jgi:hypothetical protein
MGTPQIVFAMIPDFLIQEAVVKELYSLSKKELSSLTKWNLPDFDYLNNNITIWYSKKEIINFLAKKKQEIYEEVLQNANVLSGITI